MLVACSGNQFLLDAVRRQNRLGRWNTADTALLEAKGPAQWARGGTYGAFRDRW